MTDSGQHSAAPAAMYDAFAAVFEAHASDNAYNAHYDRPAMLALAGDVRGLHVLDAGCGPGLYAEALIAAGARVSACDASPEMVRLARARLGASADVRVADLQRPLTWLADSSVDVVLLALVLHHLDDRAALLSELHRVLRPGGRLLISTTHPTADWLRGGGGYFDDVEVVETWQQDWQVRYWRRPLQAWCDEFADAGFLLERIVEPRPAPSMNDVDPETAHKLQRAPGFIAFRLLRL